MFACGQSEITRMLIDFVTQKKEFNKISYSQIGLTISYRNSCCVQFTSLGHEFELLGFEDSQHKLRQRRCASLQAKGCSYTVCMCLISTTMFSSLNFFFLILCSVPLIMWHISRLSKGKQTRIKGWLSFKVELLKPDNNKAGKKVSSATKHALLFLKLCKTTNTYIVLRIILPSAFLFIPLSRCWSEKKT